MFDEIRKVRYDVTNEIDDLTVQMDETDVKM